MKIFIERENKTIELNFNKPVRVIDVLKKLKISPETVIVVKNDEVITEDVILKPDDSIKLLSVISGG